MKGFWAALMMFTRLPLWRFIQVDKKYYSALLLYWPLTGFVTGFTTWGIIWLVGNWLPALFPVCILGVTARLILTGALHEDGLADFLDGFGGGVHKEKILSIMKDSHIGSYGTIGLIIYFLLYTSLLAATIQIYTLHSPVLAGVIIGADVLSKWAAALMINTLDYARAEEECKNKVLYRKVSFGEFLLVGGVCVIILYFLYTPFWALLPVVLLLIGLRQYFKKKIGGYTGDCCGAAVLLAELCFYIGVNFFIR